MRQKKLLSNVFVYIVVFVSILLLSVSGVYAAQSSVNLGSAGNFVILAKSGISTTGTAAVTGNIGVSPIDSTAITGFGLTVDASNQYAISSLVTGKIYASDYSLPTPTILTTAVSDMQTAYTDAAGRTETSIVTELGAGDISGLTLAPGLYKLGTGVLINNGVTLSGSSTDVWIFQIAQDLTVGNGAIITLSGGAQAKNVFWQVAGQTTLGTTSRFKGIILCQTLIEMQTGATLNGRALAQTAVTLDANTVTSPGTATQIPIEHPSTGKGNEPSNNPNTNDGSGSSNSNSNSNSCNPNWDCTSWNDCSSSGIQTRTCSDAEKCGTNNNKPPTTKSCVYATPQSANHENESQVKTTGSENNGKETVIPKENNGVNNGNQNGNQINNQVVPRSSWWNNFRSWFSGIFRRN